MAIRVLVADDHAVVRRGVLQILSEEADIQAGDEAASGREVLKLLMEKDYDVLLLDIAMPEGSGLEVLEELRRHNPTPHVLILSMYSEKQYALRALKSGADGYLTKDSLPAELVAAIRKVAVGRKYISQALAEQMAIDLAEPSHKNLSEREFQIIRLLASGKTVSQIALQLNLSVSTVSTYRKRILEKLALKNTSELMRYAIQNDLLD